MTQIAMYKPIEEDILRAFEKKVAYGQRTKVLEELMMQYVNQ